MSGDFHYSTFSRSAKGAHGDRTKAGDGSVTGLVFWQDVQSSIPLSRMRISSSAKRLLAQANQERV